MDNPFTELLGSLGQGKVVGKRAYAGDISWIVLSQVKGNIFMAVRAGLKYPAPVELVKIEPNQFIDEGAF